MGFFEKFRGYDDGVAQEFSLFLTPHTRIHATIVIRGLTIDHTPEPISRVTTLPLGIPWRKEDKGDSQVSKGKFFLEGEEPTEDKNGVRRESMRYPWNEVGYQLIKYISCEGRYSVVYGYHFRILEKLIFGAETPPHQRLITPYLLQSLIDSSIKVKEGNFQQLAYHGLIRILIEDALQNLRTPITWSVFRDMPAEDDIKALTYDVSPTVSEEEVKQEEEDTKGDEDETDEEGADTEEHDEDEEEEEEEKEDDEEIEEEIKEETDRDDEYLQEEEDKKDREEEGNRTEGTKNMEESPRVSPEAIEREAATSLIVLSTPIKQKGKRQR